MQADPFQRAVGALIIGANDGGARHQADIFQRFQFRKGRIDPIHSRRIVDLTIVRQQAAAEQVILLGQDDLFASAGGGQRGHKTSGTRADHQQVAKGKGFFIDRVVMLGQQLAQTRSAADRRFVQLFPERPWPHEGLVIKAGPKERCGEVVDAEQIPPQAGPAVLAARGQARMNFLRGGAGVGGLLRLFDHLDQGVRLL